jgi:hypothetical protein
MFTNRRLLFALVIYTICFVLLYHFYQYLFESDGIGYLAVTKHLAKGDYSNGINGYWSPLHSWLDVPFYKAGINEVLIFRIFNGLFGAGILIAINGLLNNMRLTEQLKTAALFVCIPIVLSYTFNFGVDQLLCLLLLVYANLILERDLFNKPGKIILCGIIGCLSYFAKTYAFVFFLLHFTTLQLILYKQCAQQHKLPILFRNLLLGLGTFLLLATPWIYVLSRKYHMVTFGYSGSLNHQWVLTTPQLTTTQLIAEPPGSLCCFWEDTWYYPSSSTLSLSVATLLKQVKVILHNIQIAIQCFNNISFCSIPVVLALGIYGWQKKNVPFTILFSLVAVLCAGYLPVHIETRFLWTATFILLIAGLVLLDQLLNKLVVSKSVRLFICVVFFGSFLINPVNFLQDMAGEGKNKFALIKELRANGFSGKFISSFTGYNIAEELAYFTGTTYCSITRNQFTDEELLTACKENKIGYYFFFYNEPREAAAFKTTALYASAEAVMGTSYPNLILLKLKN